MKNTIVASWIAIVNESWSSLATTIRQGTWKPVSSPWRAIFNKSSDDAFLEVSSDLKLIFSQLSSMQPIILVSWALDTEGVI